MTSKKPNTSKVAPHITGGIVDPQMLRKIADVAEKYPDAVIRTGRIVIEGLDENCIDCVQAELGVLPGREGTAIIRVNTCGGSAYCQRGKQDSLSLGLQLEERYHDIELPSKMCIGVCGCYNQCAEICIKDIGIIGMANGWMMFVGGCGGKTPKLAEEFTKGLSTEKVLEVVDRIVDYYIDNAVSKQRLGLLIEEVGLEELKSVVLGEQQQQSSSGKESKSA